MRIIAGKWRRRRLKMPDLMMTRPTSDRLRETMFNVLTSYLLKNDRTFQNLKVADLFAGSGALGLEALSRGAMHVTFIEHHDQASQIVRENIKSLQAESQSTLINADVFDLPFLKVSYDLLFLDPPYGQGLVERMLPRLQRQQWLNPQAIVVIETSTMDNIMISKEWYIEDHRTSGIADLWILTSKKF